MEINDLRHGDPEKHFWLTRSAARATGVNLSQALAEKRLSPQGYSGMVESCRCCRVVDQCQLWLATQAVVLGEVFEGCVLRADLEQLKASGL